ncbi:MAG: type II toxin-antitoxin system HicB family antitoxin [Anaerolineaceae bacterium]
MINVFKYKGYIGKFEFLEGDDLMHGTVLGIQDVIHFSGASIPELRQTFHESVDDYLGWCDAEHRDPEKPFTGNFVVRIRPDLHRKASILAEMKDESLNSLVAEALEKYVSSVQDAQGKPEQD